MLITIGGVSRAGKTSLARYLQHLLGVQQTKILSQDAYPAPENDIPRIKEAINWEVPRSLRLDEFWQHVGEAQNAFQFVVAEGLFIYRDGLSQEAALKLYIEIPYELFFERRRVDKRWGREEAWYIRHVWNSFLEHGKPKGEVVSISGADPFPLLQIIQPLVKG